ncbi:MAG: hypothetical protein ACI9A7_000901 [Cyclobacteriaceae bacterium]|jgi:uncharacterized protein (DUF1684 family)
MKIFGTVILFWAISSNYFDEILQWQSELNESYQDKEESPLEKKDLKKFKGLDFFEIDSTYNVIASFLRTPNEMSFTMPTTTDRLPVYVQYGLVSFNLNGQEFNMPIFQNQSLVLTEEYEDYLFFPFTDLTNGFESYGGGRYIDLRLPNSDEIRIDFNKSYNPYCAYNGKYSCPIPPRSNDMNIEINAGVKKWKH